MAAYRAHDTVTVQPWQLCDAVGAQFKLQEAFAYLQRGAERTANREILDVLEVCS